MRDITHRVLLKGQINDTLQGGHCYEKEDHMLNRETRELALIV